MEDENKQILKELREIREDIDYIKRHLVETDTLTVADIAALDEAEQDFKQRKTKKLL